MVVRRRYEPKSGQSSLKKNRVGERLRDRLVELIMLSDRIRAELAPLLECAADKEGGIGEEPDTIQSVVGFCAPIVTALVTRDHDENDIAEEDKNEEQRQADAEQLAKEAAQERAIVGFLRSLIVADVAALGAKRRAETATKATENGYKATVEGLFYSKDTGGGGHKGHCRHFHAREGLPPR